MKKFFATTFRHPQISLIVNTVDALRALARDISLIELLYYNYESSYYTLVIVFAWMLLGMLGGFGEETECGARLESPL
jgi:hypothetical protein